MRTRSTDSRVANPPSGTEDFNPTEPWGDGSITAYSYIDPSPGQTGEHKIIVDENHKGFRFLRRNGAVVLGPLSIVKSSVEAGYDDVTFGPHMLWGKVRVWGNLAAYARQHISPPVLDDISRERGYAAESCLLQAYARMNTSPICSGEILKDMDKTISMLRHPFKSATKLLGNILTTKQRNLNKFAGNAVKASADAWLEHRYGWKPIIMDMDKIIQSTSEKRAKYDQARLVARAQREGNAEKSVALTLGAGIIPRTGGMKCVVSSRSSYRTAAGVIYDKKSQTTGEQLQELLGLRPHDLPRTLWERTPFSFVLDWFGNVGDWLSAVTPNPSITVRGSWLTIVDENSVRLSGLSAWIDVSRLSYSDKDTGEVKYTDPIRYTQSLSGQTERTVTISRQVNPSLPAYPSFLVKPLGTLNSVTAAALSLQPILGSLDKLKH